MTRCRHAATTHSAVERAMKLWDVICEQWAKWKPLVLSSGDPPHQLYMKATGASAIPSTPLRWNPRLQRVLPNRNRSGLTLTQQLDLLPNRIVQSSELKPIF